MTSQLTEFKRVLVGLPQTGANLEAVNAVADLAEFLHIELLATFVTDSSLHTPAGFPAVRELRIPDHGWQTIDLAQIRRDIDRAAAVARQRFYKAVGNRTIKTSFDIVTGTQVMASLIRADDIVAIIEPTHPGDRVTLQFTCSMPRWQAPAPSLCCPTASCARADQLWRWPPDLKTLAFASRLRLQRH